MYGIYTKTHIFLLLKLITEGLVQIPITKKVLDFGRTQRGQSVVGRGNEQCGRQNKRKQGHDTHHSKAAQPLATKNAKHEAIELDLCFPRRFLEEKTPRKPGLKYLK